MIVAGEAVNIPVSSWERRHQLCCPAFGKRDVPPGGGRRGEAFSILRFLPFCGYNGTLYLWSGDGVGENRGEKAVGIAGYKLPQPVLWAAICVVYSRSVVMIVVSCNSGTTLGRVTPYPP